MISIFLGTSVQKELVCKQYKIGETHDKYGYTEHWQDGFTHEVTKVPDIPFWREATNGAFSVGDKVQINGVTVTIEDVLKTAQNQEVVYRTDYIIETVENINLENLMEQMKALIERKNNQIKKVEKEEREAWNKYYGVRRELDTLEKALKEAKAKSFLVRFGLRNYLKGRNK